MSVVSELKARIPERPVRVVAVTCVTETPFTVYLDGDASVAVRARIMAGSTFSSGDSGLAYWAAPSLPICFKAT
jgi:spore coat protein U-like protein